MTDPTHVIFALIVFLVGTLMLGLAHVVYVETERTHFRVLSVSLGAVGVVLIASACVRLLCLFWELM